MKHYLGNSFFLFRLKVSLIDNAFVALSIKLTCVNLYIGAFIRTRCNFCN